ncbi:ABC transporter ATP-binding protein [Lysinibacter sp. HNR]|uniref:ATP-binding cassette domain-containing protein n=1 Tax=Lysinibacter sp. HNR TaxID=3031408 RepID=UPI002435ED90|nr:ABC transporter ATP-binding protein [Lysinibacter sp. HNR]WGD36365.1 ABC transporter ATP-binding protein [Lysinibacter sp. HNR]
MSAELINIAKPDPVIARVSGLSISSESRFLVRDVSFEIRAGECVALVGESGSGKTLTTRSLLGLVPSGLSVEADELVLDGRDVRAFSPAEWRQLRGSSVGLVSQDALVSLDPLRRIGHEVAESLIVHRRNRVHAKNRRGGLSEERRVRVTGSQIRSRVLDTLTAVHMPDPQARWRSYPHELSGGLRQRALIAQGIVGSPSLLIADEPTTALDSTLQARILDLLRELKESGMAVLLVSHDLGMVAQIADRVLVMRRVPESGTISIVERGTPQQIMLAPRHEYTRHLVGALPTGSAPTETFGPTDTVTSDTPCLEVRNLHKDYRLPLGERVTAVSDVSFSLYPGTTLGIVGESGSGKSTVARIVMGLEKPDSGVVLLDGEEWSGLPERRRRPRRSRIQLIHQDPYSALNPRRTVRQSVAEALVKEPREGAERRVKYFLAQVGLAEDVASRFPAELSGGQRQRVAIARALAAEPMMLVCDEAVSALDVSIRAEILQLLRGIQQDTGLSLLFISHDLAVVREMSHELIVMSRGKIVESGPTESVLAQPATNFTRELIVHSTSLHAASDL